MESLTSLGTGIGTILGLVGTILGLIGTASAVVLSWEKARAQSKANKRQASSQAIDDLDQVRKALMEEINRLSAKVECLKQENEQLRAENAALEEKVSLLEKRVGELEVEHERLRHLRSNV